MKNERAAWPRPTPGIAKRSAAVWPQPPNAKGARAVLGKIAARAAKTNNSKSTIAIIDADNTLATYFQTVNHLSLSHVSIVITYRCVKNTLILSRSQSIMPITPHIKIKKTSNKKFCLSFRCRPKPINNCHLSYFLSYCYGKRFKYQLNTSTMDSYSCMFQKENMK